MFDDRHELAGGDRTQRRMTPPEESLRADGASGLQIDPGLEDEAELVRRVEGGGEALQQLVSERMAASDAGL